MPRSHWGVGRIGLSKTLLTRSIDNVVVERNVGFYALKKTCLAVTSVQYNILV